MSNSEYIYPRKTALESPTTLATVINAIMVDKYGDEVYDWDPVTCALEVKEDFNAEICTQAMDRWCAVQAIMGSNAFFNKLDVFMNVCNTLASGAPSFMVFDPVTVEEAAWAVAEVAMLRDVLPFSYPIKEYMRLQLANDGFDVTSNNLPPVFIEMFSTNPDEHAIMASLSGLALYNGKNIENFLLEQMLDLDVQFKRIPDLKKVDITTKNNNNE